MNKLFVPLAAVATCLTLSTMAFATSFIIDDFVAPPAGQSIFVANTGTAGPDTVTGLTGAVGGARTLGINVTSSQHKLNSTLTVTPDAPGTLSFSNDSGQNAIATVLWDAGGLGLGGVDLTNGGTLPYLQTKIIDSDLNVGFRIDITEIVSAGGATAYWESNLGPGITFVYQVLSSFTNASNVDFTQVDSILLTLTGPDAQDSTLDMLEITNTPVPEPASLALIGLGSLAMLRRRRKGLN